jgi:hypothetical protein
VGLDDAGAVGEDGGLIAGHARVLAARQLGIAEIPVMVAAGWTEAQKRAYVLADNQLAITGSGWDPELLRLELGELKLTGRCRSTRCRRRAICGCWGGIVSSAATAPWRPTLRVCSVASRRTLWSPTRPTALITTRLGGPGR